MIATAEPFSRPVLRFAWLCFGLALAGLAGCAPDRKAANDPAATSAPAETVRIGSKKFTESVLLGELARAALQARGYPAERQDLGGTPACWLALTNGDIDLYPEYTGTIRLQILQEDLSDAAMAERLKARGIGRSAPLGFANNYALGMKRTVAARLGIRTITDLRQHPRLRCGFIPEFLDRPDGWPGLQKAYGLPQSNLSAMNHTLAYQALANESIDLMELYTTDGEIALLDLVVLEDDLQFFPRYDAVWLYRLDWAQKNPQAFLAVQAWEGKITASQMQSLNAKVQAQGLSEVELAQETARERLGVTLAAPAAPGLAARVGASTREHLILVVPSLTVAALLGLPLGVLAARRPRLGQIILNGSSLLQTIPSLALLLFMIPLCQALLGSGTGAPPAIAALVLYSLLPIVRNTVAGLDEIPWRLRESAWGLGLPACAILWRIELPLAAPTILAGLRTAAVINVGSATLGGFIGAGGYGRPILRGLDKFDLNLMLEGAIPAAVMALVVDALLGRVERLLSRHRRALRQA